VEFETVLLVSAAVEDDSNKDDDDDDDEDGGCGCRALLFVLVLDVISSVEI